MGLNRFFLVFFAIITFVSCLHKPKDTANSEVKTRNTRRRIVKKEPRKPTPTQKIKKPLPPKTYPISDVFTSYVDPTGDFSLLYPRGWKLYSTAGHLWLNSSSTQKYVPQIHIMSWDGEKASTTGYKKLNTYFNRQQLKLKFLQKKELKDGTLYQHFAATTPGGQTLKGFAIIANKKKQGVTAFIYCKKTALKNYNLPIFLVYTLQSMSTTSTPSKPIIPVAKLKNKSTKLPQKLINLFAFYKFKLFIK